MTLIPAHRRKRDPYARQVLGVRVRPAVTAATADGLKVTAYRRSLLNGIRLHEVKAGKGSFAGQWRWSGVTVTHHVARLIAASWVQQAGKHVDLTPAGQSALDGTP